MCLWLTLAVGLATYGVSASATRTCRQETVEGHLPAPGGNERSEHITLPDGLPADLAERPWSTGPRVASRLQGDTAQERIMSIVYGGARLSVRNGRSDGSECFMGACRRARQPSLPQPSVPHVRPLLPAMTQGSQQAQPSLLAWTQGPQQEAERSWRQTFGGAHAGQDAGQLRRQNAFVDDSQTHKDLARSNREGRSLSLRTQKTRKQKMSSLRSAVASPPQVAIKLSKGLQNRRKSGTVQKKPAKRKHPSSASRTRPAGKAKASGQPMVEEKKKKEERRRSLRRWVRRSGVPWFRCNGRSALGPPKAAAKSAANWQTP